MPNPLHCSGMVMILGLVMFYLPESKSQSLEISTEEAMQRIFIANSSGGKTIN